MTKSLIAGISCISYLLQSFS